MEIKQMNTKIETLIADAKKELARAKNNLQRKNAELDFYVWAIKNRKSLCNKTEFSHKELPVYLCLKTWRMFWQHFKIDANRGLGGCYKLDESVSDFDEVVALRAMKEIVLLAQKLERDLKYHESRIAAFETLSAEYDSFLCDFMENMRRRNATVIRKGVDSMHAQDFFKYLGYVVHIHNDACVINM